MCQRCIVAKQLTYQHERNDAVEVVIRIAVRHLHYEVGLYIRQLGSLAADDDDLCHRLVVGVHLTNEVTLVTLYILLVGHQINDDGL